MKRLNIKLADVIELFHQYRYQSKAKKQAEANKTYILLLMKDKCNLQRTRLSKLGKATLKRRVSSQYFHKDRYMVLFETSVIVTHQTFMNSNEFFREWTLIAASKEELVDRLNKSKLYAKLKYSQRATSWVKERLNKMAA